MIENQTVQLLTPSEQVLLRADEFVQAAGVLDTINMVGKFDLLHKPGKVQARGLSLVLFSAALLAARKTSNLRLEISSPEGLFSFFKGPTVVAYAHDGTFNWPEGSLEERIVQTILSYGRLSVAQLIYEVLERDDSRYFNLAPELVKKGLAVRNLLLKEYVAFLKVFISANYSLPESTAQLLANQPIEPVYRLLEETKQYDAMLWKLLQVAIEKGMERRTDKSSSD